MLEAAMGFILGWFFGWITTSNLSPKTYTIKLREENGVWYAFEQTKGITVRAETRKAVVKKMRGALEHV